jgi:hypothetical protein
MTSFYPIIFTSSRWAASSAFLREARLTNLAEGRAAKLSKSGPDKSKRLVWVE